MIKLILSFLFLISSLNSFTQVKSDHIDEGKIYGFINSYYAQNKTDSSSQYIRLVLKEPAMENIEKVIPSIFEDSIFSTADIEYFKQQILNSRKFIWKEPELVNMKLFAIKDLSKYFQDRKGWKKFHKKYGNQCLRAFSMPIFSRDGQYCLFYWDRICNYLDSRGNVSIYKKVDGKWKQIKSYLETVS